MTRTVLIVGQDPDTVDFADPALIPGMTADKVRAGLAQARKLLAEAGLDSEVCLTDAGETAEATVAAHLSGRTYDCVVIGGGIRLPPSKLLLFEKVLNAVHRHAPGTPIAFNTSPADSAAAALRWVKPTAA